MGICMYMYVYRITTTLEPLIGWIMCAVVVDVPLRPLLLLPQPPPATSDELGC